MFAPTSSGIYLDYNALAPVKPQVRQAMAMWQPEEFACNPLSIHTHGRQAKAGADEATATLLATFKAPRVVWTSGCTEANSMVLATFKADPLVCPRGEHPSLSAPNVQYVALDDQGQINLHDLEKILKDIQAPFLMAFSLAHGETGVLQPAEAIVNRVHAAGGYVHIDAAQAVGRLPLDFDQLGADYLSFTSSKCGGPCGIGGLFWKSPAPLEALLRGSGRDALRPGTLPLSLVVGCVEALCACPLVAEQENCKILQQVLETTLLAFCPQAYIVGNKSPRLCNTTVVCMPGVKAETQWVNFDLEGISISRGAACRSGQTTPAPILGFMGLSESLSTTAVRISTGWATTRDHIEKVSELWKTLYTRCSAR